MADARGGQPDNQVSATAFWCWCRWSLVVSGRIRPTRLCRLRLQNMFTESSRFVGRARPSVNMTPESFCCAYWDWLRGIVALEPIAAQHGLSLEMGEILKRQCDAEWKRLNPT